MKQRRLVLALVLVFVLSSGTVFTACSTKTPEPSAEEITAQKAEEEKKAAMAPFVGIWEAKSINDPDQGEIVESVYPTARDAYKAIYGYDFAEDGIGLFIRFGAQKPFTWSVDADGKLTLTLAGNAGSYTATVDSSTGQMTIEGSDGSKAVLTQVTKTSGDYSSLKYKPFDAMADRGTIGRNFSSKIESSMRFKLKTEVNKVLIDNDDIYVRYMGIAKSPDGYMEGYVFEIINKPDTWIACDFRLDNSDNTLWSYDSNYLERGERVYAFVINSSNKKMPLADLTKAEGVIEYHHIKDGKSLEDNQKQDIDLAITQDK